jgi:Na+/H+ antiporter NhaD/arsenite permease-like protein
MSITFKGTLEIPIVKENKKSLELTSNHQSLVFFSGILILILVPVFKTFTHLPPYMGILIGLGFLWIITEIIHGKKEEPIKHSFSVVLALRKIDSSSILFFLGILISIAALESTGILSGLAKWMTINIANDNVVVLSLGMLSAVVDNVPLVAAGHKGCMI